MWGVEGEKKLDLTLAPIHVYTGETPMGGIDVPRLLMFLRILFAFLSDNFSRGLFQAA
jgi:hypothetical protein